MLWHLHYKNVGLTEVTTNNTDHNYQPVSTE